MSWSRVERAAPGALLIVAVAACGEHKAPPKHADTTALPGREATVAGFQHPESARYDSSQDVFFVSNINGDPLAKDGNGFISRVRPDGSIDSLRFVAGGRNGAVLNAPKGLAITGDTLWTADLDEVRGFDRHTGAPVATIDLAPLRPLMLNDICAGPDGSLYVTDSGDGKDAKGQPLRAPNANRVFRIAPDHQVTVAIASDSLDHPNGITWDARGRRLLIVPWGGSRRIFAWRPGDKEPTSVGFGGAQMDGLEVLPDGRLVVTSWKDQTVSIRDGNQETLLRNIPSPADIGVDTKRLTIAVPELLQNRVEIFSIPKKTQ